MFMVISPHVADCDTSVPSDHPPFTIIYYHIKVYFKEQHSVLILKYIYETTCNSPRSYVNISRCIGKYLSTRHHLIKATESEYLINCERNTIKNNFMKLIDTNYVLKVDRKKLEPTVTAYFL